MCLDFNKIAIEEWFYFFLSDNGCMSCSQERVVNTLMGAYERRTWVQTTWILIRFWKVIFSPLIVVKFCFLSTFCPLFFIVHFVNIYASTLLILFQPLPT